MAIKNSQVTSLSANAIFTVTTGTEIAITTIMFCNTNPNTDALLDVWAVPFGSVPGGVDGQILKGVVIPATETFVMDTEKIILSSQDAIYAQVNSPVNQQINALVSYVQIS